MNAHLRTASLKGLFATISQVLSFAEKRKLLSEKDGTIASAKMLGRFLRIFPELTPEEINEIIDPVYVEYRVLLTDESNDSWVSDSKIAFRYSPKHRVDIDVLFSLAVRIRKIILGELDGLPKSAYADHQELLFSTIMKLHLYRVFYRSTIPDEDRPKIAKKIAIIEEYLGVDAENYSVDHKAALKSEASANPFGGEGNPMETIMKMASGLLNSPQIKDALSSGDNSELNVDAISNLLGGGVQNGDVKNSLGSIIDALKEGGNPEDLMKKMGKLFSNPEASSKMQELMKGLSSDNLDPESLTKTVNGLSEKAKKMERASSGATSVRASDTPVHVFDNATTLPTEQLTSNPLAGKSRENIGTPVVVNVAPEVLIPEFHPNAE